MARKPKETPPGDDAAPYAYRAPGRYELRQWASSPDRVRDYQRTFTGEAGQRVLFDLLHNVCGLNAKPLPKGGITLERLVGRQDVGVDLLEILSVSLREVMQQNVRSFQHEE